ncbi:hypothetical protein ANAEL_03280 [Anaerolineales bacterium]|nr:hypothetical protein ANAEL_03280 [Anaerolineales bacterium]
MNKLKKSLAIGAGLLILVSAATPGWAASEPCETNFTVKEGLFDKKIYKTWQDFPIIPLQTVYRRAYKSLIKDGWIINLTDKEGGVISASQLEGSPGEGGKVATLNVFIENAGKYGSELGSVRVLMIFSVPSALHASEHMVQMNLCALLSGIKY